MPQYLKNLYWLAIAWPIIAAPVLFAIFSGLSAVYMSKSEDWARIAGSVFGFAIVGMVTGFLTGLSGSSTVLQAVLPAVLSLVAGLAAFLVSRNPHIADIVAPSIGALALAILLGSLWGSNERYSSDRSTHALDYLVRQTAYEAKLRLLREQLGIPDTPPVLPLVSTCKDSVDCFDLLPRP
jgi:hypothetical protein